MKRTLYLLALALSLLPVAPLSAQTASLRGVVTDPSGALVPAGVVQLRGPGGEQRKTTDGSGQYAFPSLQPGKYQLHVTVKGFSTIEKKDLEITGPTVFDVQLAIQSEAQVMNVEADAKTVSADPDSNGSALVLGQKELATLSDDPDELSQQLQAMAGPGAGPSGAQIYIDGFNGSSLPSKSSIREIRINSNPFSPIYDRPGFGRIEILTKPGMDSLHGQAFGQYNNEDFNSRSPLLEQSTRPPYKQEFFGLNVTGPVKKNKASFTFDAQRRDTTENAFVYATDLNSSLVPQTVNQAILTPLTFTMLSPRVDIALNANNTLTVRYQNTRSTSDNQGVGSFNLPTLAYNSTSSENTVQATETSIIGTHLVNETRFQFMRSTSGMTGGTNDPDISVQGAFTTGGAQVGNSGTRTNEWEVTNTSTFTHGTHTFKWGGRARNTALSSTSVANFDGTFTFAGGTGPELDADNDPIAGTSIELNALEVYRRTLLFQQEGLSDAQIRALGGGAYQFSLAGGTPTTAASMFDVGLFVNDDWRVRPNLTLSLGARYEAQTNVGDYGDLTPRVGIAWGIDGKGTKAAKTVLRAGAGAFYDRITQATMLQALRYNGITQQSYTIFAPSFFPNVPSATSLGAALQPQQLQILDNSLRAPRNYQANLGMDRQINAFARISVNYISSRGVHLLRSRNINDPIDGSYPYGDSEIRLLNETSGFSRTNQLMVSPNINYKKLFLFGFYSLSYGKDDNEGQPANPYNLRAEWGPSSYADIRQRFVVGTSIPLPLQITLNPFIVLQTGAPYNITTGLDPNEDGIFAARPELLTGVSAGNCSGATLVYTASFGCFNVNPPAGAATIERNYGRGPGAATVMLRLSRTWAFGEKRSTDPNAGGFGGPPPGGGGGGGGMRGGGGPGGGGPPPGGAPPGMGFNSGRRYTLTVGVNAMNALNHPNYAPPNGDLTSPFFGVYQTLGGGFGPMGGASTYNRKIDFQLRFGF
jgi:hypothetical protein